MLKRWVEYFWFDFEGDMELIEQYKQFTEMLLKSEADPHLGTMLQKAIQKQVTVNGMLVLMVSLLKWFMKFVCVYVSVH